MNGTITLSKASFFTLLDSIINPNLDDPGNPSNPFGPFGPAGPVIRESITAGLLNPSVIRLGPSPEPWRSALDARAVAGLHCADE